jgi:hypothetical protein
MAFIDEVDLGAPENHPEQAGFGAPIQDLAKEAMRIGLWRAICAHKDEGVSIKFWIIRTKIRLWDIRSVLELILGPIPSGVCE